MKNRKISIRISEEVYQTIQKDAIALGQYFKPKGSINISKYCHDLIATKEIAITRLDGIEALHEVDFQLRKIGRNFNQLLHKIHTDTSSLKQNGDIPEKALEVNYNKLQEQYTSLKDILEKTIEKLNEIEINKK